MKRDRIEDTLRERVHYIKHVRSIITDTSLIRGVAGVILLTLAAAADQLRSDSRPPNMAMTVMLLAAVALLVLAGALDRRHWDRLEGLANNALRDHWRERFDDS